MSVTASGSRMTVYFPGGRSFGPAPVRAFSAARFPSVSGRRVETSSLSASAKPLESAPCMTTRMRLWLLAKYASTPSEFTMATASEPVVTCPAAERSEACAICTICRTATARCSGP